MGCQGETTGNTWNEIIDASILQYKWKTTLKNPCLTTALKWLHPDQGEVAIQPVATNLTPTPIDIYGNYGWSNA